MKKGNKFNVMSSNECYSCGKLIKQNVVDRKPEATLCYNCTRIREALKGNTISTAREVRTGARIGRKYGRYSQEKKPAATR